MGNKCKGKQSVGIQISAKQMLREIHNFRVTTRLFLKEANKATLGSDLDMELVWANRHLRQLEHLLPPS